jgi:putative transposase
MSDGAAIKADRYKVHRGEPGGNIVTLLKDGGPVIENPSVPLAPAPAFLSSPSPSLPSKQDRIGNFRFALITELHKEIAKNLQSKKGKTIKQFLKNYNSRTSLPDIFKELGRISRPTVYRWIKAYKEGGVKALAPEYRGPEPSGITKAEEIFLENKLKGDKSENKPTIGHMINKCKDLLGEKSPSHPAKLRRWANQWIKENYDQYVLAREGMKGLIDKCVPYNERDWRRLSVGDGVVADGHKLNFQVTDPFTGDPTRAVMVLFWDWKSGYPLGWEIMLTENKQCIMSALRNAIITLGKFPMHVVLDNGKAFRAKIFREKFRFEETEIPGIFDRLDIIPHFSEPYHPQSKPIERFFKTFNDWFERDQDSYIGSSINDKPAWMKRNEKFARSLHNPEIPTIQETIKSIFDWREYYIDQPLKSRDGQRPRDIFEAEKGPGVDPFILHYLLMESKPRMVHRNGITFMGWHWYHENLYGFKDYVLVFYSYYDLSQVYIFTMQKKFLCAAKPVEKVHPFAAYSEFPEDIEAVKRIQLIKKKMIRKTKKAIFDIQSQKVPIDWNRSLRDRPETIDAIKQIEAKEQKALPFKPFSDESENSKVEVQNEGKTLVILVNAETGRSWWANESQPKTDSQRYDGYHEMAKMGLDLTVNDWEWIANYERSDEWKQYYPGKNPISKTLKIKGAEDERKICDDQECQAVF